MKPAPITVECYAGMKADESPRRFTWEGQVIEVGEVIDQWHQIGAAPGWPRTDYFRARGANRVEYLVKHDLDSDAWSLEGKG